jgi:hypothetical protein
MQKLQKDLGSKALIEQRQNQTVADKQAEAMTKMGEAMDKLNIILKPIAAAFEFIGKNVELITKGLILMTALMGPAKLGGMVKNLGNMFKGMSGKVTSATTAAGGGGGGVAAAASSAGAGTAGGAGAGTASAGGAAAGGGGGFFKNLFSGAKNMVSKLNPFTALKSSIKGMGGVGGFLKTALKKIPGLNTILTGFFAYQDIKSLLENPIDDKGNPLGKEAINQQIGKIVMGGLGGILGGAVGTALGGPIGTIIGSIGGDALFKWIAGTFPDAAGALGGAVRPIFESSPEKGEEPRKFATGGIVSGATRAIVGEAGPEAVVPLREFYAKIDELIQAVKQGQNIYIGPNKLNESIGLNLHSVG